MKGLTKLSGTALFLTGAVFSACSSSSDDDFAGTVTDTGNTIVAEARPVSGLVALSDGKVAVGATVRMAKVMDPQNNYMTTRTMDELKQLKNDVHQFTIDRDWDQFHTPANLAKSIVIEAAELLECFQWSDEDYDLQHVKEELADVFNYAFMIADKYQLDVKEIVMAKLKKNALKYPVEKARGTAKKYNEL